MRLDFLLTIALAGVVAAKGKKTSKGLLAPSSSKVIVLSSSKVLVPSTSNVPVPSTSKVLVPSTSKASAASSSKLATPTSSQTAPSLSSSAVASSSVKSSSVSITPTAASSVPTSSGTSTVTGSVTSFSSSVTSSTSSSQSSSSATRQCFYNGYKPKIDPGPEEDLEKRSVAGRALIEKRADRAPLKFGGGCDEIKTLIGAKLNLRDNPTKPEVFANTNDAGGIPKWFRLKETCGDAPGLEIISDSDPDQKTTITIQGKPGSAGRTMNKYNVDHVWELKLMQKFFASLLPETKDAAATLTCNDFKNAFIDPRGVSAPKTEHPIQQLYALMPQKLATSGGKPNTLEFAGTSIQLNGKKGRILTPKDEGSSLSGAGHMNMLRTTKDRIEALRAVGAAIDFMNHAQIKPLFDRAQARLKDYLATVDTRIADPANSITLSKPFVWADEFETFIRQYLKDREEDTWEWVDAMLKQVKREIAAMPKTTPEQEKEKNDHEGWLQIFEKSAYSKKAHYKIKWTA
ncbi:hypothetical protein BU23DRAFT_602657 [Bimuria novae-zelandiae CBS 107.79]|uniref:Uncharacterized protein n=1 Tax=Bimuria novae-zelandiae CBS 107.79 TaxID=1447943 RepID=A0A6A5V377_9PLEO|nr:hypothetical protein BU23DRAFT_602657 [Bimuria novae-zelandiae CBS 107.79]